MNMRHTGHRVGAKAIVKVLALKIDWITQQPMERNELEAES